MHRALNWILGGNHKLWENIIYDRFSTPIMEVYDL